MSTILIIYFSFEVKICKRGGLQCSHCVGDIVNGQQISQCQECRVSTHVTCSHELPPNCTPIKKEEKSKDSEKEVTSEIESWVTIWE